MVLDHDKLYFFYEDIKWLEGFMPHRIWRLIMGSVCVFLTKKIVSHQIEDLLRDKAFYCFERRNEVLR